MSKIITADHLGKALNYTAYRHLMMKLTGEGKTTGSDQSQKMTDYTAINNQRMSRLDKTVKLLPELIDMLQNVEKPMYWLVLTESWCGDAAQNLPALAKMTDAAPYIE